MDNEELMNEQVTFEPKPGFDLVKYGNVFTFNFNQEFAQRLRNILVDCERNQGLRGQILLFFKMLRHQITLEEHIGGIPSEDFLGELSEADPTPFQFVLQRFQHVFAVVCEREFVQSLNQLLTQFLVQKRVSPALFSFAKQLEGALYPKRYDYKTRYADEF
jgi:hypothetical protein